MSPRFSFVRELEGLRMFSQTNRERGDVIYCVLSICKQLNNGEWLLWY